MELRAVAWIPPKFTLVFDVERQRSPGRKPAIRSLLSNQVRSPVGNARFKNDLLDFEDSSGILLPCHSAL
jgi:hypothetical protein